jgi:hypothetical protein
MLTSRKRSQVNIRLHVGEHKKFANQAWERRMTLSEWFRTLARREIKRRANNKPAKAT